MTHAFDTIEKALEDLRAGKIILVTDDPDRENEGDFICAGEFATPENINFMAVHGRGLQHIGGQGLQAGDVDDHHVADLLPAHQDDQAPEPVGRLIGQGAAPVASTPFKSSSQM